MRIQIDDAGEPDTERLTEIYACKDLHRLKERAHHYVKCYLDYWRIKVARVDGKIEGACFWRPEGELVWGLAWIEDLWVEPKSRKLGIGEKLLRAAIEDAKSYYSKEGIELRKIALTTPETNHQARSLYSKAGFVEVANAGELYVDGVNDLILVRDFRFAREMESSSKLVL